MRAGLAEGASVVLSGAFALKSALRSGELSEGDEHREAEMKALVQLCLKWRLLVIATVVMVAVLGVRSWHVRCSWSLTPRRCRRSARSSAGEPATKVAATRLRLRLEASPTRWRFALGVTGTSTRGDIDHRLSRLPRDFYSRCRGTHLAEWAVRPTSADVRPWLHLPGGITPWRTLARTFSPMTLWSIPLLLLASLSACGSVPEGEGAAPGAGGISGTGGAAPSGGAGGAAGSAGALPSDAGEDSPDASAGTGTADAEDGAPTHVPEPFPLMPYAGKYAGVDSLTGAALAKKLCELVSAGYDGMSYTAARQVVLQKSDNHAGKVLGVYDGFWHDPTHSSVNIEHTWPQSKGADTLPAKSDLHHLFPVQANFNSARSNLPFGEVVQRDWPATLQGDPACSDSMLGNDEGCYSIKGKDAAGVEVFEPRDAHKGDAARAVFYFSIRYGVGCAVKPLSDFDSLHPAVTEAVLKKWNVHDPPSDHERQRNDVIGTAEGVRNPFIDHPELVDAISFQ